MRRLLSALRTDVLLQSRNQLYPISVVAALLTGAVVAWLSRPEQLALTGPTAILFFAGGSTLLYVTAMILLEKSEGVLSALIVSPLRHGEYLLSKLTTLSAIALLEAVVMLALAIGILSRDASVPIPSIALCIVGTVALGFIYTLAGVVVIVRFERLTDAILQIGFIGTLFQLPGLYFLDAMTSPLMLLIPTSAPTMLLRGAFVELEMWQWAYAMGYTVVSTVVLWIWAQRAFVRHIVEKAG